MAISLVLNNESLPRPLTHDLFLMTLKAFKAELRRVEINDLREGTFYAVLVLSGPEGRTRVDCRPSDAIALAMRAGAPILVEEEVLRLSAEEQQRAEQSTAVEVTTPIPDAATDMVRRVGAQKEADMLGGACCATASCPPPSPRMKKPDTARCCVLLTRFHAARCNQPQQFSLSLPHPRCLIARVGLGTSCFPHFSYRQHFSETIRQPLRASLHPANPVFFRTLKIF